MERNPARDILRNKGQKRTHFLFHQEIEHLHKTMDAYAESVPLPSRHLQRDIVSFLLLTGCEAQFAHDYRVHDERPERAHLSYHHRV